MRGGGFLGDIRREKIRSPIFGKKIANEGEKIKKGANNVMGSMV